MTNSAADDLSDDELYRRLAPHHLRDDGTVNSSAFKRGKDFDPSVSVDLARLVASPEVTLRTRPDVGLAILRVGGIRAVGLTMRRDPLPDNPAHCLIEGLATKDQARRLAGIARVLIYPRVESP